ncbi:DUF3806 domain-containing protein [Pseudoteredinibacter isoporae]|uniref:DUF3806 domain-containing protein n=1 Tax=Pseudoteredinibacter isoporae TaxID=570281 RepID=UPI003104277D
MKQQSNMAKSRLSLVAVLCMGLLCSSAFAQDEELSVKDLGWIDRSHIQKQIDSIDEISRRNFGGGLHGTKQDLKLMQRIIDRSLIKRDDRLKLQALGAVLGQVLVNEEKLEWQNYEDRLGKSRAVCVPKTQHCLFPITMLSRRMEVGLLPRVNDIYKNAIERIEAHMPKNPYDVDGGK